MTKSNTNKIKRELTIEEINAVSGGSDSPDERQEITDWYESRGLQGPDWNYVDRLNQENDQAVNHMATRTAVGAATGNPDRAIAGGFWGGVTLVTGAISNFFFRPSGGGKVTVEEVVKQE